MPREYKPRSTDASKFLNALYADEERYGDFQTRCSKIFLDMIASFDPDFTFSTQSVCRSR